MNMISLGRILLEVHDGQGRYDVVKNNIQALPVEDQAVLRQAYATYTVALGDNVLIACSELFRDARRR